MDPQKFGEFVQGRRKELGMNQTQLAEKLHVTAKAVSRWERGVGFPDIKLLQPLADALEITIVELMQSKRIESDIPKAEAATMVTSTVDALRQQERLYRNRELLLFSATLFMMMAGCFLLFAVMIGWQEEIWIKTIAVFLVQLAIQWSSRSLQERLAALVDAKTLSGAGKWKHYGLCLMLLLGTVGLFLGIKLWQPELTWPVLGIIGLIAVVVAAAICAFGHLWTGRPEGKKE